MAKAKIMSKKKISQDDLRRIMNEHKNKLSQAAKKIESPLAKYTADGELTCIVCESVVRSEGVWVVHLNSKQHRDNLAKLKKKKENEANQARMPPPAAIPAKRPAPAPVLVPPKKLKGILKNAPPPPNLPKDFFDGNSNGPVSQESQSVQSTNALESLAAESDSEEGEKEEEEEKQQNEDESESGKKEKERKATINDEALPEGFFDDPLLDAKARNVEYKDPIEEEWEKFQKEIKEETSLSAQIISEDQEEATAERQIDEIDEQMRNWSRVLDLEKKKEEVVQVASGKGSGRDGSDDDDDLSSADEAEFEEYLDWRSKKSYK